MTIARRARAVTKLWFALRRIFATLRTQGARQAGATPLRKRTVQDYVALLDRHPGTRVTTVRLLGGRSINDNVLFAKEVVQTVDDHGNAIQAEVFDARLCSSGHVLDQNVRATGLCAVCGALTCSAEGCSGQCSGPGGCGKTCCAKHRYTYEIADGKSVTYCSRCRWQYFMRSFWGMYQ